MNNVVSDTNVIDSSQLKINKFSSHQNQKPSYFMQITFVDDDEFHIEVLADQKCDYKRKLYIKDINNNSIIAHVKIKKGMVSRGTDVDVAAEHSKVYYLGLYEDEKANQPLPNSTQLQLVILPDKSMFPPDNHDYKPNCIDLSTVFKIQTEETHAMDVYWSIPTESFGEIEYKIINDDTKEEEVVSFLPYSIPFLSIPTSFKVITMTKMDGNIYQSNPITIDSLLSDDMRKEQQQERIHQEEEKKLQNEKLVKEQNEKLLREKLKQQQQQKLLKEKMREHIIKELEIEREQHLYRERIDKEKEERIHRVRIERQRKIREEQMRKERIRREKEMKWRNENELRIMTEQSMAAKLNSVLNLRFK
eukprot:443051_1